ncbi:hypothetical protein BLA29_014100, partial [Euroglyphus maynei]
MNQSRNRSFGKVIDINRIGEYHHQHRHYSNLKQSIVINKNEHDDDGKMFKTLKNDDENNGYGN